MLLAPFISRVRKKLAVWSLAVVGGIFGVLPDLLGLYGYFVRHDHGALYNGAHHGAVKDVLQYIPMYALHLGVDSLTHDPDRQWYGWNVRIWLQLILWVINIVLILWFVKIWRRNHPLSIREKDYRQGAKTMDHRTEGRQRKDFENG